MFKELGDQLKHTFDDLRGRGRLNEDHVNKALRDVRVALLEADVGLPVVKVFIDRVKSRSVGEEVMRSLTPGQAVVKIVYDELVNYPQLRSLFGINFDVPLAIDMEVGRSFGDGVEVSFESGKPTNLKEVFDYLCEH